MGKSNRVYYLALAVSYALIPLLLGGGLGVFAFRIFGLNTGLGFVSGWFLLLVLMTKIKDIERPISETSKVYIKSPRLLIKKFMVQVVVMFCSGLPIIIPAILIARTHTTIARTLWWSWFLLNYSWSFYYIFYEPCIEPDTLQRLQNKK